MSAACGAFDEDTTVAPGRSQLTISTLSLTFALFSSFLPPPAPPLSLPLLLSFSPSNSDKNEVKGSDNSADFSYSSRTSSSAASTQRRKLTTCTTTNAVNTDCTALTDGNIDAARDLWFSDEDSAIATYGHIKDW